MTISFGSKPFQIFSVKELKAVKVGKLCPYCKGKTELVTGDVIYPHRTDLYKKYFWICKPCDAYVGTHPGTDKPLGRLADENLRSAKRRAHAAFDPLWKSGKMTRKQAYQWLADQMQIAVEDCHIGWFDERLCLEVIEHSWKYQRGDK